jgi:broad specificity phosphatase PhoE
VRLLLIRHGESLGNAAERAQGWQDEPLTELGGRQASALARRLQRESDMRAIYASPLLRARGTAEIMAGALGLGVQYDDRLKEQGCGVVTGLTREEIRARYPEIARNWLTSPWHVSVPGEGSRQSFQERVLAAMGEIATRHAKGGAVAVVAHGGTLSAYLAGLFGLDFRKRQAWCFDNASLSIVVLGGVRPRLALLNDTCHLDELSQDA